MRLGSFADFTPSAARRLIRDMGDQTERLLDLVEADANGLKKGVRVFDSAPIRERLTEVQRATPKEALQSPLTGEEIMALMQVPPGREVGRYKDLLTEQVLEGNLLPEDKAGAEAYLKALP